MKRILTLLWLCAPLALAQTAFTPPPEFLTEYRLPATTAPPPRAAVLDSLDTVMLIVALALAALASLHHRSRRMIVALAIAGALYFGFYRRGCICPVGALQNAAVGLTHPNAVLPWVVGALFLLPLAAALLFGRVFCASVCPLGVLQELTLIRPRRVPPVLDQTLGLLRHVVLGLVVMVVVTGGGFLLCRFDPYVGFYRLSAPVGMLAFGGGMLLLGTVIGRPYCRWICPYAVLLSACAAVSKWRLRITPDICVQCRLCENACPYGAIRPPRSDTAPRRAGLNRLAFLLLLLPVLVLAGAGLGRTAGNRLAVLDPTLRTAIELQHHDPASGEPPPERVAAFLDGRRTAADLMAEADAQRRRRRGGGMWLGAWLGLVFGGKLLALSVRRTRTEYAADPADCVHCGRCFAYCPRDPHHQLPA